jgi:predicted small lipoprotein YifL
MRVIILSILLGLTLTACGSKGPLYLPERQYPQGNP